MDHFLYAYHVVLPVLINGAPHAHTWLGTVWAKTDEEAFAFARGAGAARFGHTDFHVSVYRSPGVTMRLQPHEAPSEVSTEAPAGAQEGAVDAGGVRVPPGSKTLN